MIRFLAAKGFGCEGAVYIFVDVVHFKISYLLVDFILYKSDFFLAIQHVISDSFNKFVDREIN